MHIESTEGYIEWLMVKFLSVSGYICFLWKQVLWISDDGIPDLGGIPEEEPSFLDEVRKENWVNSAIDIMYLYSFFF